MRRLVLSSLAAMLLAFFTVTACKSSGGTRVAIPIEGMDCEGCATKIAKALRALDGVASALVSFPKKQAVVDFDDKKVTLERIAEEIRKTGFRPGPAARVP